MDAQTPNPETRRRGCEGLSSASRSTSPPRDPVPKARIRLLVKLTAAGRREMSPFQLGS
ncbi:hypothetical protein CGCTS75_v002825 [Colletotrichum tropicale]|nr:hypothetical protein CGCTS75_v002825 [Colletotrichum tropicale]